MSDIGTDELLIPERIAAVAENTHTGHNIAASLDLNLGSTLKVATMSRHRAMIPEAAPSSTMAGLR
jgi:hypothetical protein